MVDTNILVRRALTTLWSRGATLYYTSQILGELWNVCTRPTQARGGLGLTIELTDRRVRLFDRNAELPDRLTVHEEWCRLLVAHAVNAVQVHDARLVAAMHIYGVTHLLTFNGDDFRRYPRRPSFRHRGVALHERPLISPPASRDPPLYKRDTEERSSGLNTTQDYRTRFRSIGRH